LIGILNELFQRKKRDYWLDKLEPLGIPHGPLNNIKQTFEHPQVHSKTLTDRSCIAIQTIDHPDFGAIKLIGPPVKFSKTPSSIRLHPPTLSEHASEILELIGYSTEKRNILVAKNVIL
jgi:succinate--hydroxymethylglutarate CoA-transferase